MQYRFLAKEHLKRASGLLATGDTDQLIYACLELRKCIEAVSYELLNGYLAEAPMKLIMETWQPDKVFKELVRIDPSAEQNTLIRVRRQGTDGEPNGPWRSMGEDRRPKSAWVSKAFHQLGSFLHIPTIRQQREGGTFDAVECRQRAVLIQDELTRVLGATVWNFNIAMAVNFDCTSCKAPIRRRSLALDKGSPIECGNCGQLYEAEPHGSEGKQYLIVPHSLSWDCPACGEKRDIVQSKVKDGVDVSCKCGDRAVLRLNSEWVLQREADAEPPTDA
ncbi:hypothetical protein [Bradyrhizobium sp. SEMIA]|uniref:hypothetical protein n=1 Tax=Bradyrhizobium sp. SEMIA TaxID=2597515 RepID=UPI0018A4C5A4|nr:hypothetical protein [Bradyrhizobium sp. SEMIA]QOG21736.1 hypothetical protein FOM02_35020 [Bradyrhizobium sp. SEMIA]